MAKKLTIVVENIDEQVYNDIWNYAKSTAKQGMGVEIEEVDEVTLEFQTCMKSDSNIMGSVISGAITCHLMMTADKIFNEKAEEEK